MHPDRLDALSRSLADTNSRRSVLKLFGVGVAGTAVTAVGLSRTQAKKNSKKKNQGGQNLGPFETLTNIPISGQEGDQKFKGRLSVLEFVQQGQGIVAVAQLTGKVDKPNGKGKKRISRQLRIPVAVSSEAEGAQAQGAECQILNLVLGPINLNLLGLRLRTNEIRIRLTADSGGGILGSLLCGLLGPIEDNPLNVIVDLLNQILGLLGGGL